MRNWSFRKSGVNYNFATKRWQAQSKEKSFFIDCETILITEQLFAKLKQERTRKEENVQAIKSIGRMPWHQEPMKDATNCEKPRGAVNKPRSVGVRMGKPSR